jgi:hypothetical protein
MNVHLSGQIEKWPEKSQMTTLLQAAGLAFDVGQFSIRMKDMEHFVFQSYGGDLGEPTIDADASSLDKMLHDASRMSSALALANLKHRFEIYDEANTLVGYLHHHWPQ